MSFVDLHIHSRHSSDGEWSVERICREVDRLGMVAFSIADHDTTAAVDEALGLETQAELVPNVEISTRHRQGGRFHLLAPYVDWRANELQALLQGIRNSRTEQARRRTERLQELGFDIDFEEVSKRLGSRSMTGPALAAIVLERGTLDSRLESYRRPGKTAPAIRFYKDYFRHGCPAYAARSNPDLSETIRLVRRLGGAPTLAHPGLNPRMVNDDLLDELRADGLIGLEVYTSYHDTRATDLYSRAARRFGFVAVAGSDYHGAAKPQVAFGGIRNGDAAMLKELRRRACRSSAPQGASPVKGVTQ